MNADRRSELTKLFILLSQSASGADFTGAEAEFFAATAPPTAAEITELAPQLGRQTKIPLVVVKDWQNEEVKVFAPAGFPFVVHELVADSPDASNTDPAEFALLKQNTHPGYPGYQELS